MRRLFPVVSLFVAACAAGMFAWESAIVKAELPFFGPWTGRTHLIVREGSLRVLAGGDARGQEVGKTYYMQDQDRNGNSADPTTPYIVPAGKVFVATDVQIRYKNSGSSSVMVTSVEGWIRTYNDDSEDGCGSSSFDADSGERYFLKSFLPNAIDATQEYVQADSHLTGGIPFAAGARIGVHVCVGASSNGNDIRIRVLGYEVECATCP